MEQQQQTPVASPTHFSGAEAAVLSEPAAVRVVCVHRVVFIKDGELIRPAPAESPERAAAC
jgi:hypothetical protein